MMASLSTLPPHSVVDDLSREEQELLVSTFSRMRSGGGFRNDVRQPAAASLERQVTQPALVVASASDGQVRWKHAEQLGRSLPHATTWTSPSLSHLIWFGSGAGRHAPAAPRPSSPASDRSGCRVGSRPAGSERQSGGKDHRHG